MTRSEQINELATALAKAQGAIEGAKKDAKNPHFGSKYAALSSVWDACREPLSKHGLSVVQLPRLVSVGESSWLIECETALLHETGQFLSDTLAVPVTKVDAQGVGSAITYARRYSLMALLGIAPEDDDANAAVGASADRPARKQSGPQVARVKVLGIVQRPTGKADETKYVITADDKQTYQTFLKPHAEAAKLAQEAGLPVDIQYRQDNFGRVIVAVYEVNAPEPPL